MEKIMVGAATGVMNSLLRKLTTMMEKEYILLTGVERDIALLKEELLSMNLFLFKLADIEDLDVQAKDWRDRVRELSYDIEDCIDHIMHNDSPEAKGGLVCKVANKIRKLWSHHEIGKQIQELRTHVMEESTRRDRYSLDDSFARPRAAETDHRLTALFVEANRLEGIDRPMEQIMQWLTAKGESDQGLKFISIVGFGGLGKTTLAIQAYNKVRDHFDCAAFVSVSRNPSIRKVLMNLLKDVGADIDTTDDEGRLINNIRGYLNKKRFQWPPRRRPMPDADGSYFQKTKTYRLSHLQKRRRVKCRGGEPAITDGERLLASRLTSEGVCRLLGLMTSWCATLS